MIKPISTCTTICTIVQANLNNHIIMKKNFFYNELGTIHERK